MKKSLLSLSFVLYTIMVFGQAKPVLVFDLINGSVDSLPLQEYDDTRHRDHTDHFIGSFNSAVETLSQSPPTLDTYPGSSFSYKQRASTEYDLTHFPIRTSVKLFAVQDGVPSSLCSGSMVSRRHVLTAAHCVSPIGSNTRLHDSISVFPAFDSGVPNTQFGSSYVSKIYFFRDWDFLGDDFAILELAKPIGASTGWISIGFDDVDSVLSDGIFYKFTYPARTIPAIDSTEYNGDSLYYNYGKIDLSTPVSLGIEHASGIPGESGSSLIRVVNDQEYISYGVLSLSNNLYHSRINAWQFYALKSIINNDLVSNLPPAHRPDQILVYPNPVADLIYIDVGNRKSVEKVGLFESTGQLVLDIDVKDLASGVDVSALPKGVYYLRLGFGHFIETRKIVINNNR